MGCCSTDEIQREKSARIQAKHGKILKPTKGRWCTDIICLMIWFACSVGFLIVAILAGVWGDVNYIVYPVDYLGQFCGHSSQVASTPKIYYPQLDKDIKDNLPLLATGIGIYNFRPYGLCVDECPGEFSLVNPLAYGGSDYPGAASTDKTYYSERKTEAVGKYCLPTTISIPADVRNLCGKPFCDNVTDGAGNPLPQPCANIPSTPSVKTAWVYTSATESLCEFKVTEVTSQQFLPPDYDSETGYYETVFAQTITNSFIALNQVWEQRTPTLVMGLAMPFAFAMVWFILLFVFAGFIVFLALFLLGAFLIASTLYLYGKAGLFDVADIVPTANISIAAAAADDEKTAYVVFAILDTILTLIFFVLVVLWRRKIARAIAIVRETTKVFYSIPILMAYPLVQVAWYIGLFFYCIFISGFILTQGQTSYADMEEYLANLTTIDDPTGAVDAFTSLEVSERKYAMLAIHLIGCVWTYYFIHACVYTTYAGVAARWFFSHENGKLDVKFFCGVGTIFDSAWCVFSRHLGSMAFGSAVISIVQAVRMVLEYIDQKTQGLQESNCTLRMTMKCVKCCLWCAYKTIKFITEYGYIFIAVEGSSFCGACKSTFELVTANFAQVTVNKMVGGILALMISVSIPVICAFICFLWAEAEGATAPIWPAVASFVLALLIAKGVSEVFRCTIDTLFLSAFKDMDVNKPPFHMSEALRKGFGIDETKEEGVRLTTGTGGSQESMSRA